MPLPRTIGPLRPKSSAISRGMTPMSAVRLTKMWFTMRRTRYSFHFSSKVSQKRSTSLSQPGGASLKTPPMRM